jgi:hypothetical protein
VGALRRLLGGSVGAGVHTMGERDKLQVFVVGLTDGLETFEGYQAALSPLDEECTDPSSPHWDCHLHLDLRTDRPVTRR